MYQNLNGESGFDNIIGTSARMREIFSKIKSVADKDIIVLIGGESGTGKELVAQAIHNHSHRRNAPYIKVNCAAIPDTLIESELFGHEKGAFTGAYQRKVGKFELANNGTLFLDEIGDMALATQSRVLRIIQEREFERLGGIRPLRVNVRIITATHRNLIDEVARKRFREDLFFRINVVFISLPPLREKREDIPVLTDYFIEKFCAKFNIPLKKISDEVRRVFYNYSWPGNVRELQNVIESAVAIEEKEYITLKSLPYPILTEADIHFYGRRRTDALNAGKVEVFDRPGDGPVSAFTPEAGILIDKSIFSENPRGVKSNNKISGLPACSNFEIPAADKIENAVDLLVTSGLNYDQIEKLIIESALKKSGGNQLKAARLIGIGRGEMQYKVRKFKIKINEVKKTSIA